MRGSGRGAGFSARRGQGFAVVGAAILLVLFATSPGAAQFACTTTPADITCTNAGIAGAAFNNTATSANQNATTNNGGTAAGFGSAASGGGNATATNSGSNVGTGNGFLAVTSGGGNATATNSGSNSSSGNGMGAATNTGGNATATNSGSNFGGTNGIIAQTVAGGNATATNSGTNSAGFNGLFASTTAGGNATAINSGGNSAATNGMGAVTNGGGNATAINTGSNTGLNGIIAQTTAGGNATIINFGGNAGAITAMAGGGGSAIVINSGSTSGVVFVSAPGGSEVVTNSGTISDFGGTAIQFAGGPDTLNLRAGSNITGAINLVGTSDTVNFLSGNHNLTFNTLVGATANGPDPFVVSGNRAAAIDPTPFGLADKNLMDFTRGISGILDGIGGSVGPSGPISSAFAPSEPGSYTGRIEQTFASIPGLAYADDQAMVFKAPTVVTSDGRAIWARGFGGERRQDPDGVLLGANTAFFGGAAGFDILARPDLRLGLFAGGGESRMALDLNQGSTNTNTAFGGLYGRWGFVSFGRASFLDFALHGGGSTNSTSRTINNNTLPGGLEIATASYNSSYISPELKYGIDVPLWAQYTLTPSLRLRYVAGFFGGYTESGTTAPLTVSSRTIQDLEERAELKLTRAQPIGPDLLLTSVHLGAIGIERAGDTTVDAVLLGANLPFVTPGKNDVAGVVGGAGFAWRTREGISLFGAGEAIGFSDQSVVWSVKGGVRAAF